MDTNKYHILILSDLKESSNATLKSTVNLAKKINANITLFHVKTPIEVVRSENQLLALKSIKKVNASVDKQITTLIEPFTTAHNININYNFTVGRVKEEIKKQIDAQQPDIIVMGKRVLKPFNIDGNNVTDFVLTQCDVPVLIASNKFGIEPDTDLSPGFYNGISKHLEQHVTKDLFGPSTSVYKTFKFEDQSKLAEARTNRANNKEMAFVFDKNDNALNKLSGYLIKNNINLLCIDREDHSATTNKVNSLSRELKTLIKKMDVSLFVLGGRQTAIQ